MATFAYYGVIRDDQYLLTTVKLAEDNIERHLSRMIYGWFKIYPDSKFRVAKLTKRGENGWVEYTEK